MKLKSIVRKAIIDALHKHQWKQSAAARELGISDRGMGDHIRRMRADGVPIPRHRPGPKAKTVKRGPITLGNAYCSKCGRNAKPYKDGSGCAICTGTNA